MIQEESYLKVADNTGAKEIKTTPPSSSRRTRTPAALVSLAQWPASCATRII